MSVTDGSTGHAVPLAEVEGRLLDPSTLLDSPFTADGTAVTDDTTGDLAPFTRSEPVPPEPVVVFSDDFNRADGPLGSPWVAQSGGGLEVISNEAGSPDSDIRTSTVDAGTADHTVAVDIPFATGQNVVVARFTDISNYVRLLASGAMQQVVAGTPSTIGTMSGGVFISGDRIALTVDGATVTAARNGVQEMTGTTTLLTGTHGGLLAAGSEFVRFDNFEVTA